MSDSISTFFAKLMFILMAIGWLAGCTGMKMVTEQEQSITGKCGTPTAKQALATLQRNAKLKIAMSEYSGYSIGIIDAEWFGK